ncbi:MAG: hypothetical protein M1155_02620 [Patescibacteria group bacterium]|nr:hypothetical protein [Patescibacteria group bacterium]
MKKYYDVFRQFISEEHKNYKVMIGKVLASSLSGFIAGAIFASIFWAMVIFFLLFFPIIFNSHPYI